MKKDIYFTMIGYDIARYTLGNIGLSLSAHYCFSTWQVIQSIHIPGRPYFVSALESGVWFPGYLVSYPSLYSDKSAIIPDLTCP